METTNKPFPREFFTTYEMRSDNVDSVFPYVEQLASKYKVIKLVPGWHISDLRSFYSELTRKLGKAVMLAEDWAKNGEMTGDQWMEIRYDDDIPDLSAFRHSKNAQPLHTDESYKTKPSDIMIFYCQNKAEQGGETVFVDGDELVERMRIVNPSLLERVSSSELTYEKAGSKRTSRIISLNDDKPPTFNFNYFCLDSNESNHGKLINQEFFDFLETHVKGSYLEKAISLQPGESVIWWDHFVLHGRRPFQALKTDDRFIWKTAVII